jgi:hypothetical protein
VPVAAVPVVAVGVVVVVAVAADRHNGQELSS